MATAAIGARPSGLIAAPLVQVEEAAAGAYVACHVAALVACSAADNTLGRCSLLPQIPGAMVFLGATLLTVVDGWCHIEHMDEVSANSSVYG